MDLSIGIIGATGKMGRALLLSACKDLEVKIGGGCASAHSPHIGRDLGQLVGWDILNVPLSSNIDDFAEKSEVLIDFSLPNVTLENLRSAIKHQKPLVIGSTGHDVETRLAIESLAKQIPLFFSPNFSLGMALCLEACAFFGRHLKGSCFVDIVETHHIQKKDAPSGTALALARTLDMKNICPGTLVEHPRSQDTLVIHSIRAGNVTGEHHVIFECQGEQLEIKHTALSRDAFARGALRAAKFLAHRSPGLYTMKDLLHL